MATVSLCMIVKNEEAVLARCLESAAEFADEMIVVDTGSTDETVEIAKKFTNLVYHFPWQDDFSAARNFAFERGTKDYLFWLDADDVISQTEQKKLLWLKSRLDTERPDVVMMKYAVAFDQRGNPTFTFYRERLIRNCRLARWHGKVHEVITPFGSTIHEEITIEHHKVKAAEAGRNLRIFEKMREKGEPFDVREQYYYGKELYYNGRYREAASVLEDTLENVDGWVDDKLDACRHAAACWQHLEEEEKVISVLLKGLQYGAPRPELCCDIGSWFFRKGQYEGAIFWYRSALRTGKTVKTDGFVQEEMKGYLPCIQLCACYDRLGKTRLAVQFNEWAERFCPGSELCAYNREYFKKRK